MYGILKIALYNDLNAKKLKDKFLVDMFFTHYDHYEYFYGKYKKEIDEAYEQMIRNLPPCGWNEVCLFEPFEEFFCKYTDYDSGGESKYVKLYKEGIQKINGRFYSCFIFKYDNNYYNSLQNKNSYDKIIRHNPSHAYQDVYFESESRVRDLFIEKLNNIEEIENYDPNVYDAYADAFGWYKYHVLFEFSETIDENIEFGTDSEEESYEINDNTIEKPRRNTIDDNWLPDSRVTKKSIVEPVEVVKPELTEELKKESTAEEPIVEDDKANVTIEENKNEETISTTTIPSKVNIATNINDFVINKGLLKKYTGKDKDVVIPDGIKTIGVNSFYKNKNIESVIIPEGVNIIQKGAFKECNNLKNISFPSTITKIDQDGFVGCKKLFFKEIPPSLSELLCDIHIDSNVKKLSIPNGLEFVKGSIYGNYEELYISKFLKEINNNTFSSKNLNRIIVDKDNKDYDSRENCNAIIETNTNKLIFGINETIIPTSIKIIGEDAFFNSNIQKLVIPEGVEIIEKSVFCIDGLREIYIPKTVTNIIYEYGYQFMSDSLEIIKVSEDNCTYYSDDNSSALIEKTNNKLLYLCKNKPIPKTVKIIGSESLNLDLDCLVVPEGVEELEKSSISNLNYNCSFNSFILPSSIKKIGEDALRCSKINTVNIYAKKENIMKPNEYYDLADDLYFAKELIWVDFTDEKKDDSPNNLITLEKITNKKAYASISYDCENYIYYISILNDGTIYFTSHKKKRYGSDPNEYFYYKKSCIRYIEFGSDKDIEWYNLYESDKKSDSCFHLEIIRNRYSFYAVHNSFIEEDDFEDSSNKLKELINFIINFYGKDNIKFIELNKGINNSNNNINTTNYNNTSNNSYNSYNSNKYTTSPKKSGCYIATCVYGSYDCKEVWRLRRYRDYYLDNHWFGRIFIKLYYSISPTLVKLFGNKKWFKSISKRLLDKKISKLVKKGYEDTPYNDKY